MVDMKEKIFKVGDKLRLADGTPVMVKFIYTTKLGQKFHGIGIDDKRPYRNVNSAECRRLRRRRQK